MALALLNSLGSISSNSLVFGMRHFSTRVRFAPSPTGFLHLGGLRTALYNYLFAKSTDGTFVLRIEDTDQTRRVEGSVEALVSDLRWAGLNHEEGPDIGGLYGPYVQSERLHIYKEHIQELISNGSAYYCFCTERRLNIIRRDAMRMQLVPKYDNKCRELEKGDIEDNLAQKKPYCIRFKLSSNCSVFEDIIFGNIAYDVSINEGDPVLMKSDGYPTYHFANVVDDHLMGITHVLRGVEWQISTTKHLQLYNAFGWSPPQFGHLPLIVNADGTKLSKRQSDVKVEDYRKNGIYPLALLNYLTHSGGGFDHVPGAGVHLKTLDDLSKQIKNVSSHPSRMNPDLLRECNRLDLKRQMADKEHSKVLIKELQSLILEKYSKQNLNVSESHLNNVLLWSTQRISNVEELVSSKFAFLWVLPATKPDVDISAIPLLVKEMADFESFNEMALKAFLKEFSSRNNLKFSELMKILRSLLSGLREGPGVAEMMEILGKDQTLVRLNTVLQ